MKTFKFVFGSLVTALVALLVFVQHAPAQAGLLGMFSFDINKTIITQDPDILMSVNVRPKGGYRRSLAGINSHKGVHCLVADLDRMELVPVVGTKRKPLEIIDGGYTLYNTGDYRKWPKLEKLGGNIGASIDLESIGNGDQFLRMWVLIKHGSRTEIHWPFGGTAKNRNLDAQSIFSFHVLSLRDGDGNLYPRFLHNNGRTDYDEVLQVLKEYGSGVTPSILLKGSRERLPDNNGGAPAGPIGPSPSEAPAEVSASLVINSSVRRYVMVQWLDANDQDGPQDKIIVEANQPSVVRVREGFLAYDLYDRLNENSEWLLIKNNGEEKSTPAPSGRRNITLN